MENPFIKWVVYGLTSLSKNLTSTMLVTRTNCLSHKPEKVLFFFLFEKRNQDANI